MQNPITPIRPVHPSCWTSHVRTASTSSYVGPRRLSDLARGRKDISSCRRGTASSAPLPGIPPSPATVSGCADLPTCRRRHVAPPRRATARAAREPETNAGKSTEFTRILTSPILRLPVRSPSLAPAIVAEMSATTMQFSLVLRKAQRQVVEHVRQNELRTFISGLVTWAMPLYWSVSFVAPIDQIESR